MTLPAEDSRVLVMAEDPLARAGLAALLAGQRGLSVVAQMGEAGAFPADLALHRPDALVWDTGWNPAHAGERLAALKEGGFPVIALVGDDLRAAEAWAGGADAVLPRDASPGVLIAALHAVMAGLLVVAPGLGAVAPRKAVLESPALADPLTAREVEVLALLAEGLPNKVISSRLGISDHTVKFHINSILGKLGAQSRTEAVTQAIRMGLVHL